MSNTGTTASAGFEMKEVSGFLKEIQGYGGEILETAGEIERLLEDGFSWVLNEERLKDMKASMKLMLEELAAQPDFIDLEGLKPIVEGMKTQVEEALGGISMPSFDLDLGDMLQEMKKMLPDVVPGIDLSEIKPKVESIVDKLTDSGVSYRVLKDNPALAVNRGKPDPTQTGKPALKDRGKSSPPARAPESPFDQALKNFFSKPELTALLDPLPGRIEQAIADSGIMLEVEEQVQALQRTLTDTSSLSLDLIITEIAKIANVLSTKAIDLIKGIIDIIVDSIRDIYEQVKKLGDELSGPVRDILKMLNLGEAPEIGTFTLPAILLAIPATVFSKITKTDLPDFSGILQMAIDVETQAKAYGGVQFTDGAVSFLFGIVDFNLDDDNKYKFPVSLAGGTCALILAGLAQIFSVPALRNVDENKRKGATYDLPTFIWDYQLLMLLWSTLMLIGNILAEKGSEKWKKVNFVDPMGTLLAEVIHLGLFIVQFVKEQKEDEQLASTDLRLGVASLIDPLPGLIRSSVKLFTLATEPFSKPKAQIDTINSAVDAIGRETAVNVAGSVGDKMNLQRSRLLAAGDIRRAFEAAQGLLAPNGPIKAGFNGTLPKLTQSGAQTLEAALNEVKTRLGVPSTIEADFNTAAGELPAMEQKIATCLAEFEKVNPAIPKVRNALPLLSDPSLSQSMRDKLLSFVNHFDAAKHSILIVKVSLEQLKKEGGALHQARDILLPGPGPHLPNTIGAVLADLDTFHNQLKAGLQTFGPLLDTQLATANRAATDALQSVGGAFDTLKEALRLQNRSNGSIGKSLADIEGSLVAFKRGLEVMANDQASNAIETRLPNVIVLKDGFLQELNQPAPLFQALINSNLNGLENVARTVAETLSNEGDTDFARTYQKLLKLLDPERSARRHGETKGIGHIREAFIKAIADANTQLEDFQAGLENDIATEMRKAGRQLNKAESSLKGILELIPNPIRDEHKSLKKEVDQIIALTKAVKASANVEDEKKNAKQRAEAIKTEINKPEFGQRLSAAGPMGSILSNAANTLAFDQNKNTLQEPLQLIEGNRGMLPALQEIVDSLTINRGRTQNTIERKIASINKGVQNLQKAATKKARKKKKESSKGWAALSLGSTLLLKSAYAGLNWHKANHPSPEIEKIVLDPSDPPKLTATLKQIEGESKDLKNIKWEGKDGDNWKLLDGTWIKKNTNVDKSAITLKSLSELTPTIRAKLYYKHGYVSKELHIGSIPPNAIALSSNAIREDEDTTSPVPIGALTVTGLEGTAYKAADLSLSGEDADEFQIVDINNTPTLQLKAGTTLNYEGKKAYQIIITAIDPKEIPLSTADDAEKKHLSYNKDFTITIINVNEAPRDIVLNLTAENALFADSETIQLTEAGNVEDQILGTLSATDPDGQLLEFTVIEEEDFYIQNNELRLVIPLTKDMEFTLFATETKPAENTSDSELLSVSKKFQIKIPPVA